MKTKTHTQPAPPCDPIPDLHRRIAALAGEIARLERAETEASSQLDAALLAGHPTAPFRAAFRQASAALTTALRVRDGLEADLREALEDAIRSAARPVLAADEAAIKALLATFPTLELP